MKEEGEKAGPVHPSSFIHSSALSSATSVLVQPSTSPRLRPVESAMSAEKAVGPARWIVIVALPYDPLTW